MACVCRNTTHTLTTVTVWESAAAFIAIRAMALLPRFVVPARRASLPVEGILRLDFRRQKPYLATGPVMMFDVVGGDDGSQSYKREDVLKVRRDGVPASDDVLARLQVFY